MVSVISLFVRKFLIEKKIYFFLYFLRIYKRILAMMIFDFDLNFKLFIKPRRIIIVHVIKF